MCGLAGYVDLRPGPNENAHNLEAALELLSHRGPDSGGSWFGTFGGEGEIGLGHRRLSVIDLSSGANQPMTTQDESYVLCYNGEIYNYQELRVQLSRLGHEFRTSSDTEVLLNAWKEWGTTALEKFDGMFAFAIYDVRGGVLTLARDRHGMKPIYFTADRDSQTVFFASEPLVAARLAGNVEPDHEKAYQYLTMGLYDFDDQTFFKGVNALRPGSFIRFRFKAAGITRSSAAWVSPKISAPLEISFDRASEQVQELLMQSVSLHLRSDVEVAIALSGGLDSSAIAGAARKIFGSSKISTFSYVSPGYSRDESAWASKVAKSLGTNHQEVEMRPPDALLAIERVVREQGEPTNSSSALAQSHLYSTISDCGYRVVLDGQGADELFAGYSGFPEFRVRSLIAQGNLGGALLLIMRWSSWSRRHSVRELLQNFVATLAPEKLATWGSKFAGRDATPSWIDSAVLARMGVAVSAPQLVGYPVFTAPGSEFLRQHLNQSLFGGDLMRLLRHGDRSSMAHSVESRLPFLGQNLVSFVQTLPEEFLLSQSGETKRVLRSAVRGLVPDDIIDRRDKVGFETPEEHWLEGVSVGESRIAEGLAKFEWIRTDLYKSPGQKIRPDLKWRLASLGIWASQNF